LGRNFGTHTGQRCESGRHKHGRYGHCDDDRVASFYGVLGFIMGAIGALIYNAVAGIIGGIKFELEGVQQEYAPPPPPHEWAPQQYPAQ